MTCDEYAAYLATEAEPTASEAVAAGRHVHSCLPCRIKAALLLAFYRATIAPDKIWRAEHQMIELSKRIDVHQATDPEAVR